MKIKHLIIISVWISTTLHLIGQPTNDDCFMPIEIDVQLGLMCTSPGGFSTIGGTSSVNPPIPACWPMASSDVWFTFRAAGTSLTLTVNGNTVNNPAGSLNSPELAIYSGICGGLTELNCSSDATNANSVEVSLTNLIVGQRYYIRVSSRNGLDGTFQLCFNSFNQAPDPTSDCPEAVLLCDKSNLNVGQLLGTGTLTNEIGGLQLCLPEESQSVWYTWVCDQPGTLTFTLTPNNPGDDLDFILFELPGGLDDCANKQAIRCMASGENVGAPFNEWAPCTGATGLMSGDPDMVEDSGCQPGNNNFLAEVNMVAGQAYALMVNNFSESGQGFAMEFGGTGTFLGPEVNVNILDGQTLEDIACDKEFTLDDSITFATGSVASIEWSFGVDATPQSATGSGPHTVTYGSIGQKSIVLSVTSDRGCITNEILNFDVLPCCEDFTDFDIMVDSVVDVFCFGDGSGQIAVSGIGGNPFYEYSLDGASWQFNDFFDNLEAGTYDIHIRDRKGCLDTTMATIAQPEELIVDAGPDQEVGLGCEAFVEAITFPANRRVVYSWSSTDSSFVDPAIPNFSTIPQGEQTYTVTVTDEAGCTDSDDVVLSTDDFRPIYIPSAFSPNNDGINERFTVYGNKAASGILELSVYNRWGGRVFGRRNIDLNDPLQGWDGTFNGEILNPGVFTYVARVLFIDDVEKVYSGDIHLFK